MGLEEAPCRNVSDRSPDGIKSKNGATRADEVGKSPQEFSLTVHHLAHVTDRPRPAVRAGGIMGATINHSCRLDRSGNDGTNGCSWLI
jgi:hypothetical protein